jgi:hypothetical protein
MKVRADQFAERIAEIRARFGSKLSAKIADTDAALPDLAGGAVNAVETVAATYRRFHEVCGIAPTIGCEEIGRVARNLDAVLIGPFRAQRGLTAEEIVNLKQGLDALRVAVQIDLQRTNTDGEQTP